MPQDEQSPVQEEPQGQEAEETPTAEAPQADDFDLFNEDPEDVTPPTEEEPAPELPPEDLDPPKGDPPAVPDDLKKAMEEIERREIRLREQEGATKQAYVAAQELAALKKGLKEDPMEAFRRMGGDPTALMEAVVGPDPEAQQIAENPVVKKLMSKIEALEADTRTKEQQARAEHQRRVQADVYQNYSKYASEADPAQFPTLKEFSDALGPTTMFEKTAEYAQTSKTLPPAEQIARESEDQLSKLSNDLIKRLSKIPQYAKLMSQMIGEGRPEQAPTSTTPQSNGNTLRQQHSATPPPARVKDWSKIPDKELVAMVASQASGLFDEE